MGRSISAECREKKAFGICHTSRIWVIEAEWSVLRLLLLVGGLAVALGLAEALTALGLPRHACGGRVPFWRPDRATGWALVPG